MLKSTELEDKELFGMESFKIMVDLSEGVFHDLKNILATISGLAQLSLIKDVDDDVKTNLINIVKATLSFKDALDRYYNFTQGYNEEEKKPYDIQSIILKTVDMVRFKLDILNSLGNEIQLNFLLNSYSRILCNEYELRQSLLNIIMNAIESMEDKSGTLSLKLYDLGNKVYIEIKDTGVGISPENMERLFKVEFTTKAKGTGLGLKIAKRSIEKNGGEIEVCSKLGEGTRFLISFPIYHENLMD
jgi:signal transduction histidine kinase